MAKSTENGRSLGGLISEIAGQLGRSLRVRVELLSSEVSATISHLKVAVPLLAAAIVLLTTAYLLGVLAIVAGISAALGKHPHHGLLGFFIVGLLWALLGLFAGYCAKRELGAKVLAPKRTIELLKGDADWVRSVRNQE
ncbi:MAG: phage holin family protein [Acidobacteriales bacterium]|nr:phage holin family protein [Terriglobales bacterium]